MAKGKDKAKGKPLIEVLFPDDDTPITVHNEAPLKVVDPDPPSTAIPFGSLPEKGPIMRPRTRG